MWRYENGVTFQNPQSKIFEITALFYTFKTGLLFPWPDTFTNGRLIQCCMSVCEENICIINACNHNTCPLSTTPRVVTFFKPQAGTIQLQSDAGHQWRGFLLSKQLGTMPMSLLLLPAPPLTGCSASKASSRRARGPAAGSCFHVAPSSLCLCTFPAQPSPGTAPQLLEAELTQQPLGDRRGDSNRVRSGSGICTASSSPDSAQLLSGWKLCLCHSHGKAGGGNRET